MKKKKNRKFWFRCFKGFLKIFIRKPKIIYLGEKISEPSLILSNHVGAKAPLNLELYFPKPFRFWGTYEMNSDLKSVYKYLSTIYFHQKKHMKKGLAKFVGFIVAPLLKMFYSGLRLISTYKDSRFRQTIKESWETIKNGENIIIFPEDSSQGYFDNITYYFKGFVVFADICYKKGVDLPIFVSYYRKKDKTYIIDKPVRYSELLAKGMENQEIANMMCNRTNELKNYKFNKKTGKIMREDDVKSKVFFTKDISQEGLLKIYKAMGVTLSGKVAVKLSTGEPGGHHFLNPQLIQPLVNYVGGTIVESCTAYKGRRFDPKDHWEVMKEHGFYDIAPCDILDEDGEIALPVTNGKHLKENYVGKNLKNYDSMLVLSHFKGHQMGGFGGALKNISIGIASREGKAWIHTAGKTKNTNEMWRHCEDQDAFLESMAEASESIISHFKPENMVYINVANNLSIDCDCNSNPKKPEMADIGIFASTDPVALDQCCYDQIINSTDKGKKSLIDRMKEKNAIHIIEQSHEMRIGNRQYSIIDLD